MDDFSKGFVEILAAEQSYESTEWFQGTADAVRRSLVHTNDPSIEEVIVLSGDQLFSMDLNPFQAFHRKEEADITVACHPVLAGEVSLFGIMGVDRNNRISSFSEKPASAEAIAHEPFLIDGREHYLASMGIYIFKKKVLADLLTTSDKDDFGKEIIPDAIKTRRVLAYIFRDYWVDIGTIRSYFQANLMLTERLPSFNLYNEDWPIYTRPRFLPPAKMENCRIRQSIIADGCVLEEDTVIENSVVGVRSRIGRGTKVESSVLAGHDFYENPPLDDRADHEGSPRLGIGSGCLIRGAIVDKNARIGNRVRIVNDGAKEEGGGEGYTIRDGIVIVHKGAIIPDETVI